MSLVERFEAGYAKVMRAVTDSLLNEVANGLKSAVSQSVQENVYDAYTPEEYVRRQEGGLGDPVNYDTYVDNTGTTLYLENQTRGNPAYANTRDGYNPGYITDIIESGIGYKWTGSRIYKSRQERPFMEEALTDYVFSGDALKNFREGMERNGYILQ